MRYVIDLLVITTYERGFTNLFTNITYFKCGSIKNVNSTAIMRRRTSTLDLYSLAGCRLLSSLSLLPVIYARATESAINVTVL
jgi:hypothetical protein